MRISDWSSDVCSSDLAGAEAMAEPAAWNGDALIQSLAASQLEGDAVPVIELDELAQLRPEEGAVGEDGAAHDRIAKIAALGDYPAHGAFGIIAQVEVGRGAGGGRGCS